MRTECAALISINHHSPYNQPTPVWHPSHRGRFACIYLNEGALCGSSDGYILIAHVVLELYGNYEHGDVGLEEEAVGQAGTQETAECVSSSVWYYYEVEIVHGV